MLMPICNLPERSFTSYAEDETLLLFSILDPRLKTAFKPNNRITIAAKEKLYEAAALVGPSQWIQQRLNPKDQ